MKGYASGEALAAEVGISGPHMLRIERGYRQPSVKVYRELLRVLDADEGDFLTSTPKLRAKSKPRAKSRVRAGESHDR